MDFPAPTPEMLAELTRMQAQRDQALANNARRYDQQLDPEDCALSWRCDSLTANMAEEQMRILRQGGVDVFWGLFDKATGQRVRAKRMDVKDAYRSWTSKTVWAMVDENGRVVEAKLPNGERKKFLPYRPVRPSTLGKYGLEEREELAPAKAIIGGNGKGLSGLASAFIAVVRTDGGCPGLRA